MLTRSAMLCPWAVLFFLSFGPKPHKSALLVKFEDAGIPTYRGYDHGFISYGYAGGKAKQGKARQSM